MLSFARINSFGIAFSCLAAAVAAPPTLSRVTPAHLTPGKATKIVLEGADLADASLRLNAKLAAATVVGTPAPNRVELEVTLDPQTSPALLPLRIATPRGISNALPIAIDTLPTASFAQKIEAVPAALYGNLAGPQVLTTAFAGKKDDALVLEVEAQRLGSNLKPVVRLYDARGKQLAWSPPKYQVGGDCRCEVKLPADGVYSVEVHDQLYRAADPAPFRLKIAALTYAEGTLPLAVQAGVPTPVKLLLTNSAGEATANFDLATPPGSAALPWGVAANLASGAAPRILVSDIPEFANRLPENTAAPAGVTSVLDVSGKEQLHTFKVMPGQKLRAKVVGRSAGSPIDAVLSVRGPKGNQLAAADDLPGSADPMVEVAAPGDADHVVVAVKDMQERGGPDFFYRVEVRPADSPDFEASLAVDRIHIPAGGATVLPLQLKRRNYDGPITFTATGLPSEIKVDGLIIPAGAVQGIVSFSAPAGVAFAGTISLTGRTAGPTPVVRRVLFNETPGATYQPWYRYEAGLAVAEPAPLQLTWNTPANQLFAGVKAPTTVTVTRGATAKGKIRFRLVTTQSPPKKKIKENNQDKEVDDVERTLRIEGAPTLGETETELAGGLNLLIPGDLAAREWDLALVAELLSADGKNVVGAAVAPARRFTVAAPFTIELAGANAAEGRAGLGEAGVFRGKLVRTAGFQQPVTVTLTGLPKDIPAPIAIVAADKSEFELPLRFPFASKPGELKNVKLVALLDRNAPLAGKSNDIDVKLKIVAGEKPPAEAPRVIFDEDTQFIAQLTEGSGQATLDNTERYSGKVAVKVTPDQKFNAKLPGLSVKIRENPGADEYRWIRFAWKKKGGKTIVLQLNHDGQWGPGGSGKEGAKFRYHAGPAGEQFGGSVGVDDKLPGDFVVVTRDLFADFGEFTLDGVALTPADGNYAIFDHIYLGKTVDDLNLAKTEKE